MRTLTAKEIGALTIGTLVNSVVGTTPTLISPPPTYANTLMLSADLGGWRIRVGDYHLSGMPGTEFPTTSVINGTGGWYLPVGAALALTNSIPITVAGYTSTSVLSYYWL